MARIRTVKPEFWQDETIGELSSNARLLFLACLNISDDEGLLKWNAAFLRSQCFIYDDLSISDIESMMSEITSRGMILEYKDSKQQKHGWFINFRKHQKIDRPQKAKNQIPSLQNKEVREAYYKRDNGVCHICNKNIEYPEMSGDRSMGLSLDHVKPKNKGGTDEPSNIKIAHFGCNAGKRDTFDEETTNDQGSFDDGQERKGTGKGKEQGTGKGTFERPSIDDVIKYMTERQWTNPESDANRWMDYFLTNGFKVTKAKTPMKDWKAAVRNWEKDGSFKKPDYSNIPCQEIANEYDRILKQTMQVSANPLTDRNKLDITKAWNSSESCQSLEWWSQIFNAIQLKLEPVDQQYRATRYTFDKLVGFEFMTVIKEFI